MRVRGTAFAAALVAVGCGCDDDADFSSQDGGESEAEAEAESEAESESESECEAGTPCGDACCTGDEVCRYDACLPPPPACKGADDCDDDRCCADGECIPFGVGPCGEFDPDCSISLEPVGFAPVVQCEWSEPTDTSNGTASHHQVMSTPVVVDFDFDDDPDTLAPSIVFSTFAGSAYGGNSVVRVIDGATCAEQYSITDTAARTTGSAPVALGDLDGDGRAEIVAAHESGGVIAFAYDTGALAFTTLWRSHYADGSFATHGGGDRWGGASLHDLDDDGLTEVIYGAVVYDAAGLVISETLGFHGYSLGHVPVLADVDIDGYAELVYGDGVWEWSWATGDWVAESYFAASPSDGFTAVGDFGDWGEGAGVAEIVVITSGTARLMRLTGETVFGPVDMPGAGTGGPPTVADFDGDGEPEFASANGSAYAVFDLECAGDPLPAFCESTGVRWSQPSQDLSSNVTGSSVFDFEGDGAAEAVYADECYLRVYDGATGVVEFSQGRSSGTTYENPVIADVDGDYNSEIVTSRNDYAGTLGCADPDPLFAGAACATAADCPSPEQTCPDGTCRAPFVLGHGIRVYADATDLWVNSRPVWNQHAYAVTNVNDDGTIPATGAWDVNWLDDALNNFRQNVQGLGEPTDSPDLTGSGDEGWECTGKGDAILRVRVCNRGTLSVGAGVPVTFYAGGGTACTAETTAALDPGECETVECTWSDPPSEDVDVTAVVDDAGDGDGENTECHEGNNETSFPGVSCEGPG